MWTNFFFLSILTILKCPPLLAHSKICATNDNVGYLHDASSCWIPTAVSCNVSPTEHTRYKSLHCDGLMSESTAQSHVRNVYCL